MLQVVYPALNLKVKNVTHAYSVEHEDEVRLSFLAVIQPVAASAPLTLSCRGTL
jgi:hypothetical protein